MRLILLGPPGAGKGTQAETLSEQLNIAHISTGDMLRQTIKSGSETGKKLKTILDQGQLVPDDFIMQIVKERLEQPDCKNGYILDGIPRTIGQAQALDQASIQIDAIVEIHVPDDVLIERLTGRRIHPESGRTYHTTFNPPQQAGYDDITGQPLVQRDDDKPDTVKKRLSVYHEQTAQLIDFYQNKSPNQYHPAYVKIDGQQSVGAVTESILNALKPLQ